ncbi:MarR family winged helix-turn-helix transcriptional regulator [Spelaeicoccus albus]|uniref:DNA-binding MarR family transcriptional regulator n=1 Tax=Spelaeicoccus albus TaxID=1280376 RepID=A0A7Z0D1P5_9MICO|nr:MarR family transcriptional regulator [Spelaeicoccus albus]NYI66490.1 DNA-binding MarR family transcriptional regulator [Spelaeicoccus albus]
MDTGIAQARDDDTSSLRASIDLRVAFGRLRRRMREVDTELSASQVSVLARLNKGEAASASALAALEGVKPQSMAVTIAALEELGLVARTPDPSDGRRHIIALTQEGALRSSGLRAARGEWLAQTMDTELTDDERKTVIDAMAIIERLARA